MFEKEITLSMDERIVISLALEDAIAREIRKMDEPLKVLKHYPDSECSKEYLKVLNARIEEIQAVNFKLGFERL